MDYLSLKFLNRGPDLGRNSDERLRKQTSQSPQGAPSPTSIKTSNSTSSHQPSPRLTLPNDDPLPFSFAALEGHLNHHASQLQQLADRVESINEWIELDNIVLVRLIRDEEKKVDDVIAAEREYERERECVSPTATTPDGVKKGVHFAPTSPPIPFPFPIASGGIAPIGTSPADKMGKRAFSPSPGPAVASGGISPIGSSGEKMGKPTFPPGPPSPIASRSGSGGTPLAPTAEKLGKRSASMGDVPRSPSLGSPTQSDKERKEEAVEAHFGIREARERIKAMKRWRKELEKAVFWQREEYWRVERRMGNQRNRGSKESGVVVNIGGDGSVDEGVVGGKGEGEGKKKDGGSSAGGGEGEKEGGLSVVGEEGKKKGGLCVVGGAKWEEKKPEKWSRESSGGRLPTQREWEALFSHS